MRGHFVWREAGCGLLTWSSNPIRLIPSANFAVYMAIGTETVNDGHNTLGGGGKGTDNWCVGFWKRKKNEKVGKKLCDQSGLFPPQGGPEKSSLRRGGKEIYFSPRGTAYSQVGVL